MERNLKKPSGDMKVGAAKQACGECTNIRLVEEIASRPVSSAIEMTVRMSNGESRGKQKESGRRYSEERN